tara:strand:- start:3084 stop:3518 length:435 start_codon:yes stop_codon:yes gene_type:complete
MSKVTKQNLTEKQNNFVHYLVVEGKNPTESARLSGYDYPKQSAYSLTRNPSVIAIIRQTRQTLYQTDLSNIAVQTLKDVMQDPDAPASARVSASRTVLELSGDLGKNALDQQNNKNLSELTPDELGKLIDSWEEQRSSVAKKIN